MISGIFPNVLHEISSVLFAPRMFLVDGVFVGMDLLRLLIHWFGLSLFR